MKKLKTVQIGLGHDHASAAFDSLLRQSDIFDVVAFAVPESELKDFADRIKTYRDDRKIPLMSVEDALNIPGLEGAVIETEEVNLTKYALMAAEKGLHIHMDKPGGCELCEFEKLINVLKEKKLAFSTGYMYRFNTLIIEALEKIKSGKLGEIYAVETHMDCEHNPEKRQWLSRFKGGMMFYLGCHLIDLIYQIMGEPEEVIPLNACTGSDGVTAEDYGMAVFKYKNGISFAKTCANEPGGFFLLFLVICGTKGTIEIRPLEKYIPDNDGVSDQMTEQREVYGGDFNWHTDGTKSSSAPKNRYDAMMESFALISRGEKENKYTYDYELGLYKLVLKACGVEVK